MDNIKFSSILCSQICHDLAGSIGVIDNSLDLINPEELNNFTKDDYIFVTKAAKQAVIQIKFIRTVFGNYSDSISFEEALNFSKLFLGLKKIQLCWSNDNPAKDIEVKLLKIIMSILYGSKIMLPYGGSIEIFQENNSAFKVNLISEKIKYFDNIITLLNSNSAEEPDESKFFPFIYAALVSKEKQIEFTEFVKDHEITYIANSM